MKKQRVVLIRNNFVTTSFCTFLKYVFEFISQYKFENTHRQLERIKKSKNEIIPKLWNEYKIPSIYLKNIKCYKSGDYLMKQPVYENFKLPGIVHDGCVMLQ